MGSTVNMKPGLQTMGVLRPDTAAPPQEPVVLETSVLVNGARPGDTGAGRQLFSEEVQTVMVFERGAVIRLSAAVADGQLLFLTNNKTGKEVVAQVLRKRAFRPTSCYVDLEFTEPCPGFWGTDFPTAGEGATAAQKAELAEDLDAEPAKPAAPPSAHEVERLKQEVSALHEQLRLKESAPIEPAHNETVPPVAAAPKPAAQIGTDLAKREEERQLEELFALEAKQEIAAGPKRLVAHSGRNAPQITLIKPVKPHSARNMGKKVAAVVFLLLTAGAVSAYRFGALDSLLKKPAALKPSSSQPATATSFLREAAPAANVSNSSMPTAGAANATVESTSVDDSNIVVVEPSKTPERRTISASPKPDRRHIAANHPAPSAAPANSVPDSAIAAPIDEATTDISGDYVGPKLLKAVKPVTPPDVMRNYVTGNVKVDALVDSTGHIKSVSVLSGPAKLHAAAIEQMKQYLYAPAKRGGKPVASHVQVSLQFWYEP